MDLCDIIITNGGDPAEYWLDNAKAIDATTELGTLFNQLSLGLVENGEMRRASVNLSVNNIRRILQQIETMLWQTYRYYSYMQAVLCPGCMLSGKSNDDAEDNGQCLRLYQREDLLIVRTPYLRKLKRPCMESSQVFEDRVERLLREAGDCKFDASQVHLYIFSVYPVGTKSNIITDADNVNWKMITDYITRYVSIDDNGLNVIPHVWAHISDKLEPATYTVLTPKNARILDEGDLEKVILDAFVEG